MPALALSLWRLLAGVDPLRLAALAWMVPPATDPEALLALLVQIQDHIDEARHG